MKITKTKNLKKQSELLENSHSKHFIQLICQQINHNQYNFMMKIGLRADQHISIITRQVVLLSNAQRQFGLKIKTKSYKKKEAMRKQNKH